MKQKSVIRIQGFKQREIESAVRRFCDPKGGNGVSVTVDLYQLDKDCYQLVFRQEPSFVWFCDILALFVNDKGREVRGYCKNTASGCLPAGSMVYLNRQLDYEAVDPQGNVYRENQDKGYEFVQMDQKAAYIPPGLSQLSDSSRVATFTIVEEKVLVGQRILNRILHNGGGKRGFSWGCLPVIFYLLIVAYGISLEYRTDCVVSGWTKIGATMLVFMLLFVKRNYASLVFGIFSAIYLMIIIPNYYFSTYMGKKEAVIEKMYTSGTRGFSHLNAVCRFDNHDTFVLRYKIDKKLLHTGDTCVLDMWDGLWGIKVCRGVSVKGKQIWEH